eukprot:3311107-Rhodomonas_salina.1
MCVSVLSVSLLSRLLSAALSASGGCTGTGLGVTAPPQHVVRVSRQCYCRSARFRLIGICPTLNIQSRSGARQGALQTLSRGRSKTLYPGPGVHQAKLSQLS